jgi:hypothetical protein
MRPLGAVLQDASAMLGQVGALLERCRALRLELEVERTPAPDVSAQAERAVYAGMLAALERGVVRALEGALVDLKKGRGGQAIEAEDWLRRQIEGLQE